MNDWWWVNEVCRLRSITSYEYTIRIRIEFI